MLIDVLVLTLVEVLQGVRHMESTPSSERAATPGSDNVRDTVRDGVGVDVKRQH